MLEFDVQHDMGYRMKKHDELEGEPCNGEVERAQYVAVTTNYKPPSSKKDLEYRVRRHIEDAAEALEKDMDTTIDVNEREIKENIEYGNRNRDRD